MLRTSYGISGKDIKLISDNNLYSRYYRIVTFTSI